jgi:hypothetical protein
MRTIISGKTKLNPKPIILAAKSQVLCERNDWDEMLLCMATAPPFADRGGPANAD